MPHRANRSIGSMTSRVNTLHCILRRSNKRVPTVARVLCLSLNQRWLCPTIARAKDESQADQFEPKPKVVLTGPKDRRPGLQRQRPADPSREPISRHHEADALASIKTEVPFQEGSGCFLKGQRTRHETCPGERRSWRLRWATSELRSSQRAESLVHCGTPD